MLHTATIRTIHPVARLLASLAVLLCAATGHADASGTGGFRQAAAAAIRTAFAREHETQVGLFPVRNAAFFLYDTDVEHGPPFITVKCARSASFSMYLPGTTDSGRASLGLINVGLCDPGSEIDSELIRRQDEMSRLLIAYQTQSVPGIKPLDIKPHSSKVIGDGLTLQSFTLLALGHGAAISPTAIVTSANGGPVLVMQFGLPPQCTQVTNPRLKVCADLDGFFSALASTLRQSANPAPGDVRLD